MFEQTFVDGVGKTKRPYTILLSFAVQIALIGVLVIIPLIFYDTLKGAVLTSALVAPAPPPPPPPPPPPQQVVKVVHTAPKQFVANQLIAPKSVPSKILMVTEEEAPLATGVIGGIPGGVPGAGGGLSGLMGGLPAAAPPKPPPAPPVPPKPTGPAKIGGNVVAANLINPVKPVYPPLAKMARQQGTVKFEAMISKEGTIEDLKLISGPPLLVQAAMDAVKQWKYKPTILNGEPTEVQTTIDVNFSLSN
jgi:periplasmic protein TonB